MRTLARLLVVPLLLAVGLASSSAAQERSPFTGVRFPTKERVEVEVEDVWYLLVAIDAIEVDQLLAHARAAYRDKWRKRVGEDLVQLFEDLGKPLGKTVDLRLQPLDGGDEIRLRDVPATERNRRLVWARNKREGTSLLAGDTLLETEVWQADLFQLSRLLQHEFAYLGLRDVEPARELERVLREHGDRPLTRAEFARVVGDLLARFGDGHSRVIEAREFLEPGWFPYLLRPSAGGVVAFRPDRTEFAVPTHPYLVSIDGVPLAQWIEAAREHVTAGSPQLVERRALQRLCWIQDLRQEQGFARSDTLTLSFEDAAGHSTEKTVPVVESQPTFGPWPLTRTHLRMDGVGYLRIAEMSSWFEIGPEIDKAMESFALLPAIVIDVRGNGGGARDVLVKLAPHFLGPRNRPIVVNRAARVLLLGEAEDVHEGHLADRYAWPAKYAGWSRDAVRSIRRFERRFEPERELWARLSGPHYFVLEHDREVPHYAGRVLVLQDAGCFSATDIFLAGMSALPGVLTAGTPSSGGSARSRRHKLPLSGLTVSLASMASWQPDGRHFDGHGVAPDVELVPRAADFLLGRGDSVLERSLELLADGALFDGTSRR